MTSFRHRALGLLALGPLAACFPSGQLDLRVVVAGGNDRAVELTAGDGQTAATVTALALTLDAAFLEGPREVVVFNEKTLLDFGAEEAIGFEVEARIGRYSKVGIILGAADAAIAGSLGDPRYEGASLRLAGTVDLDPAIPGEETPWVALVPAPRGRELQLFREMELDPGGRIVAAVALDLQGLLRGVDFAALIPEADGLLVLAPDEPDNAAAAAILQSNIEGALSLID